MVITWRVLTSYQLHTNQGRLIIYLYVQTAVFRKKWSFTFVAWLFYFSCSACCHLWIRPLICFWLLGKLISESSLNNHSRDTECESVLWEPNTSEKFIRRAAVEHVKSSGLKNMGSIQPSWWTSSLTFSKSGHLRFLIHKIGLVISISQSHRDENEMTHIKELSSVVRDRVAECSFVLFQCSAITMVFWDSTGWII